MWMFLIGFIDSADVNFEDVDVEIWAPETLPASRGLLLENHRFLRTGWKMSANVKTRARRKENLLLKKTEVDSFLNVFLKTTSHPRLFTVSEKPALVKELNHYCPLFFPPPLIRPDKRVIFFHNNTLNFLFEHRGAGLSRWESGKSIKPLRCVKNFSFQRFSVNFDV